MAFRLDDDLDELARNMYPPSMNSPHKLSGLDIGLSPFLPGEEPSHAGMLRASQEVERPSSASGRRSAQTGKSRGSYMCSRCGQPKRGHVCPYKDKDAPPAAKGRPRSRAGGGSGGSDNARAGLQQAAATEAEEDVAFQRIKNGNLVNVYTRRSEVEVERPLGMVLASRPNGKGVVVEELVDGGNAQKSRKIRVDDLLVACAPTGGEGAPEELVPCDELPFDDVMGLLGAAPECPRMRVLVEREEEASADIEALTPEQREKRMRQEYWEDQRARREARWKSGQTANTLGRPSKAITVKSGTILGEGSFGKVFEGTMRTEEGEVAVVLKRAKDGVFGAEELLTSELKISALALEASDGRTAAFLGAVEVGYAEEGQIYNGVLSTGMWGVWRLEGRRSLQQALDACAEGRGRGLSDELRAMGLEAANDDAAAVRVVIRDLLEVLAALHSKGLVHRDIKPNNMIFAEGDAVFKLIDFGASARCLGEAINHEPGSGPHDPCYCPEDETDLLPEGAFVMDGGIDKLSYELTPDELREIWEEHRCELFDVYTVGVTMLQMAVPSLRGGTDALLQFREQLAAAGGDVDAWRVAQGVEAPALDADGGAGWEAVAAMLTSPRGERVGAADSLKLRFFAAN